MKQKNPFGLIALLLAIAPLGAIAQTTFFTDTFTSGSTTNGPSIRTGPPTASATSYDIAATKSTVPGTNGVTIAPNDLHLALAASTTSGFLEAQAIFATNGHPVSLAAVGDYIELSVVFTNTVGSIFNVAGSVAWLGLYNSGGTIPLTTNLANAGLTTATGSLYATGNCAGWVGYVAQMSSGGTSKTYTRPAQTAGGTASSNQELLGNNWGSGAFVNPGGGAIATLSPNATVTLATTGAYTLDLRLTLTSATSLNISNFIYSGAGTGGTLLFSQGSTSITNATFLTTVFDGLAMGLTAKATPAADPTMDISSITVSGISTPPAAPPTITLEPVPVVVATNGACIYTVAGVGAGVTYQWYRNGTALVNGGDFSGVTSQQLLISPAQAADAAGTANGYYCVVSGTGGFSTNSVTNSLVLVPANNLTWTAAGGSVWDLNNTVSWQDSNLNALPFNYGDHVLFDDTASSKFVTLTGSFLSASSITVDSESGATYSFTGTGSIAGPGKLIYTGTGQLTLNTANTFSGGTLVSNTAAPLYVYLQNYNGLGTGPVTLNSPGGTLETTVTGGNTLGINGTINVLDNFTIQVDGTGTYATVFLGDLAGTAGKTLTINPKTAGTLNRYRAYGTNTTFNANLVLDSVDSPITQALYGGTVLAPYGAIGSQRYNGVISGAAGIVQRGTGTTYLNNQNTYSGGTFPTSGSIALGVDSTPTSGTVVSGPIGTGSLFLAPEINSATASGTVLASGGARTLGNPLEYPSGTNNLTLIIGGTNSLTFTAPFALNGIDGVTTNTYTSRILQVANTGGTTFANTISDSTSFYALTKTGAGPLYLNAANTYTGITTNSAGLLAGSGSLAGSVIVTTNASIGGGTIIGNGTLTIGGNLILTNGNGFFRLNHSGTSDQVSVTGGVTNFGSGTITVTNLGTPLQVGDTFNLFNKPVTGGSTLLVTGGGATWTNKLALNGTIQMIPSFASYPTNITSVVSNGTLMISWPATHLGWLLQSQTNALTTGLVAGTNAWHDLLGSASVVSTNLPINPASPAVFYRLRHP